MLPSFYYGVWFVVILLQRLVCHCLIAVFSLSLSYCGIWFVAGLLRCDVFRHLLVVLYLCESDSYTQSGFDRSKKLDYGR